MPQGERDDRPSGSFLKAVVMGVSGAGKSVVGRRLAEALACGFVDADDLHPQENILKMTAGIALTDGDREPWLHAVGRLLAERKRIVACSALRRRYRVILLDEEPESRFVCLDASRSVLESRLRASTGHFMPAALLTSQLDTLEPPTPSEPATIVDAAQTIDAIVVDATAWLGSQQQRC